MGGQLATSMKISVSLSFCIRENHGPWLTCCSGAVFFSSLHNLTITRRSCFCMLVNQEFATKRQVCGRFYTGKHCKLLVCGQCRLFKVESYSYFEKFILDMKIVFAKPGG